MNDSMTYQLHDFGAQALMPDAVARSMHLESERDPSIRAMVHSLSAYVASNRMWQDVQTTTEPRTWWDGWKDAHGPQWLKRRWPVRLRTLSTTITINHMCPHLPSAGTETHLRYILPPTMKVFDMEHPPLS